MEIFTKTFESEEYGQLCVIAGSNENNDPEIRVYAKPFDMGVCSSALVYDDTDDGWNTRDTEFDGFTLKQAEAVVKPAFELSRELTG